MFLVATNHLCQVSSNFETSCQISKIDPMYHNENYFLLKEQLFGRLCEDSRNF